MPTALQGFRENNRERRGVGPPCQHSRAFSASGKGLKRWPLILSPTLRRKAMNRYMTLGLSMLAGAALGAAAIQALHAQAKPIGYAIAQNVVTNEEGYTNEFLPQITK